MIRQTRIPEFSQKPLDNFGNLKQILNPKTNTKKNRKKNDEKKR